MLETLCHSKLKQWELCGCGQVTALKTAAVSLEKVLKIKLQWQKHHSLSVHRFPVVVTIWKKKTRHIYKAKDELSTDNGLIMTIKLEIMSAVDLLFTNHNVLCG